MGSSPSKSFRFRRLHTKQSNDATGHGQHIAREVGDGPDCVHTAIAGSVTEATTWSSQMRNELLMTEIYDPSFPDRASMYLADPIPTINDLDDEEKLSPSASAPVCSGQANDQHKADKKDNKRLFTVPRTLKPTSTSDDACLLMDCDEEDLGSVAIKSRYNHRKEHKQSKPDLKMTTTTRKVLKMTVESDLSLTSITSRSSGSSTSVKVDEDQTCNANDISSVSTDPLLNEDNGIDTQLQSPKPSDSCEKNEDQPSEKGTRRARNTVTVGLFGPHWSEPSPWMFSNPLADVETVKSNMDSYPKGIGVVDHRSKDNRAKDQTDEDATEPSGATLHHAANQSCVEIVKDYQIISEQNESLADATDKESNQSKVFRSKMSCSEDNVLHDMKRTGIIRVNNVAAHREQKARQLKMELECSGLVPPSGEHSYDSEQTDQTSTTDGTVPKVKGDNSCSIARPPPRLTPLVPSNKGKKHSKKGDTETL